MCLSFCSQDGEGSHMPHEIPTHLQDIFKFVHLGTPWPTPTHIGTNHPGTLQPQYQCPHGDQPYSPPPHPHRDQPPRDPPTPVPMPTWGPTIQPPHQTCSNWNGWNAGGWPSTERPFLLFNVLSCTLLSNGPLFDLNGTKTFIKIFLLKLIVQSIVNYPSTKYQQLKNRMFLSTVSY